LAQSTKHFNPRDYQRIAIEFLLARRCAGLFAKPGSGKTAAVLTVLSVIQRLRPESRSLIVAPLEVCHHVWPAEVKKWSGFRHLRTHVLHGKQRRLDVDADIYLINPEGLPWLFDQPRTKFDTLVIDESHWFKSSNSVRFRSIKKHMTKWFPHRRYVMTGTPRPNSIEDLWAQSYIIDQGAALDHRVTYFRDRFMRPVKRKMGSRSWIDYEAKDGADEEVAELLAPTVLMLDMSKYRDVPPLLINDIYVELPPKAATIYRRVHREMLFGLGDDTQLVESPGSKYSLCCQISNGRCYDVDDKSRVHSHHNAKIKAFKQLIADMPGESMLIAYRYKHDLDQLRESVPGLRVYNDDAAGNEALLRDWNGGKVLVLAAQMTTISHGLNLQYGGSHIVWFSLTDNRGDYDQFNARIHGRDNLRRTTVHRIIAKGTADESMVARLDNKGMSQAEFLAHLAKLCN
jgi:SNF2 family DNA or RNA helicase